MHRPDSRPAPRRAVLPALVFAVLAAPAGACADDDLRVLPAPEAKAPSPLYQRLLAEADAAIARRTAEYEKVQTVDQARAWQKQRREILLRCLGPFPEKTPLNARVVGTLKGDGYTIEKVIYESRPNHHVTGNLYLPTTPPPHPGVIVPCGHSFNGKAADGYQRVSVLLARNGIAALCYDPIGQGERYQTFGPDGKPLGGDYTGGASSVKQLAAIPGPPKFNPVEEHTLIGVGSILVGTNTANYRVWDGVRSIDYLVSRPDIDAKRIGCTGNSGGGTLTAYLMAVDDRIVCAAPACAVTSFDRLLHTAGPQDAEQNLFGQLALGLDEADFLHLRAPKPTCLLAGTRDATFDVRGTWDVFREAKRFSARFDHPERVEMVEADAPHGFTVQLRVGAVRWMRRWLLNRDDAITEPELAVRKNDELWCTPKGQVMWLPGERSVFDINREREKELAGRRAEFWKTTARAEAVRKVRELAAVRPLRDIPGLKHRVVGTVARDGYAIEQLVLTNAEGVELPALLFAPGKPSGESYLYVNGAGKQADAGSDGPIAKLVQKGHRVLAIDLQGMGELERRNPREWGGTLFGPNNQPFFLAYLLGKSLVGVNAEETIAAARFLASFSKREKPAPVHVVAVGTAGPAVLHAAAVEPDLFAAMTLRGCLSSWASVLSDPTAGRELATAVHDALRYYDLPDLLRLRASGTTTVLEPRPAAK